jgi:serine/threonine protein phosphatase 1
LLEKIPPEHRTFMENTGYSCARGDYMFVHAGVRPDVPLEAQSPSDLMWMRDMFLESRKDHGKMIVHGHSIAPELDIQSNRIGVDTGAYATGHLTCLVLQGTELGVIST